jgi:hypothetical protein
MPMNVDGFKKKYIGPYGGVNYQCLSVAPNNFSPVGKYKEMDVYVSYPSYMGAFACCGAAQLQGMSGAYLTDDKIKQEFVHKLSSTSYVSNHRAPTVFFIATTSQIRESQSPKKKDKSVFQFLLELGAEEIFSRPNRLHGPNNMHLHVLDFGEEKTKKAVEKYLVRVKMPMTWGGSSENFYPRYMAEEFGYMDEFTATPLPTVPDDVPKPAPKKEPEFTGQFSKAKIQGQQFVVDDFLFADPFAKALKNPKPVVMKPQEKGPLRDAYGRFMKVVKGA